MIHIDELKKHFRQVSLIEFSEFVNSLNFDEVATGRCEIFNGSCFTIVLYVTRKNDDKVICLQTISDQYYLLA